jgi:hypothetical protein
MTINVANASNTHLPPPSGWLFEPSEMKTTLVGLFGGWETWKYLVTILLGIVVYDQGKRSMDG